MQERLKQKVHASKCRSDPLSLTPALIISPPVSSFTSITANSVAGANDSQTADLACKPFFKVYGAQNPFTCQPIQNKAGSKLIQEFHAESKERKQNELVSCRHVLSTECDLSKAPRRKTDGSIVLDTEFYAVKLYTAAGGTKFIKKRNGAVEKQVRVNIGKLPIGYRSEPGGRFLYIFKDALSQYSGQAATEEVQRPVPPCISRYSEDTVQVVLEGAGLCTSCVSGRKICYSKVDDRAANPALIKISSDYVRVQIVHGIAHEKASEEILEFMRGLLSVRLGQLAVVRGEATRQKLLMVQALTPEAVFERLEGHL